MFETVYIIYDRIHRTNLYAYKTKAKALLKLIELCESIVDENEFTSRADFEKAVRLGYFDTVYLLETLDVEL